jgi:hypothetical protein
MTFQFGTNSSANETLHKTISLGSDISCIVKDPIDILSPYLIVKDTEVNLTDNYAKCTDTNRYYFIEVEDLPGGRRGIQCTVDPLMSFATGIDALEVNVERYEGASESDIYDSGVCLIARNEVVIEQFGGTNEFVKASSNNDRTYILTVAN